MKERIARMDTGLFFAVLALLGFGVVLVYSSSFAIAQDKFGGAGFFLERQVVRVFLALVCFVVFINIDYHVWSRLSSVGFIAAVVMLVTVLLLPERHAINGSKRWLMVAGVRFQVSEFARMALIVLIASRCEELGESIRDWRRFVQTVAKIGIVCLLIVFEPDFSTAFIIGTVALTLLFMGGARFWHVSGLVLGLLPLAVLGLMITPYRRARVLSYLNASERAESVGYQAQQALIGLGNGGLFGVGLGQGKQKYFYLPEPHTDFAFSILGEEIGFIGLTVVLAVFAFIVYRGFRIALHAPDVFGRLTAFGLTLVVAVYVLVHAAVNVGLVPTTGVPLPFLSYGGVSIVLTMISIGVLLNISSQSVAPVEVSSPARGKRMRALKPLSAGRAAR